MKKFAALLTISAALIAASATGASAVPITGGLGTWSNGSPAGAGGGWGNTTGVNFGFPIFVTRGTGKYSGPAGDVAAFQDSSTLPTAISEPGWLLLMGAGLAGLAAAARRRLNSRKARALRA
jgi:hypothetical protein